MYGFQHRGYVDRVHSSFSGVNRFHMATQRAPNVRIGRPEQRYCRSLYCGGEVSNPGVVPDKNSAPGKGSRKIPKILPNHAFKDGSTPTKPKSANHFVVRL